MIRRSQRALAGSTMLLAWAALLTACGSDKIAMNDLQREDAERQALIEAMKQHPALANGGNAEATGNPINVSTTVPPKSAGGDEHHEHPTPPER